MNRENIPHYCRVLDAYWLTNIATQFNYNLTQFPLAIHRTRTTFQWAKTISTTAVCRAGNCDIILNDSLLKCFFSARNFCCRDSARSFFSLGASQTLSSCSSHRDASGEWKNLTFVNSIIQSEEDNFGGGWKKQNFAYFANCSGCDEERQANAWAGKATNLMSSCYAELQFSSMVWKEIFCRCLGAQHKHERKLAGIFTATVTGWKIMWLYKRDNIEVCWVWWLLFFAQFAVSFLNSYEFSFLSRAGI